MKCLHPSCPLGAAAHPQNWQEVIDRLLADGVTIRPRDREPLLAALTQVGGDLGTLRAVPTLGNGALWRRILDSCPCLFTQFNVKPTSRAVGHFCEVTMGQRLGSANIERAFKIQNPNDHTEEFAVNFFAEQDTPEAGEIVEMFCGELLRNEGLPETALDGQEWPVWSVPCHLPLNRGKLFELKAFGDFLIPAAPSNIIISCKTLAARERLLNSGIRVDTVGFGFFNEPDEFWGRTRINVFKRFGFTAIYMPQDTANAILNRLTEENRTSDAVNVNGTQLFRPLSRFAEDMRRVVGRRSLDL